MFTLFSFLPAFWSTIESSLNPQSLVCLPASTGSIQGVPFSQTNLCVAQPLNTLMRNPSVMGKHTVAQVLLAGVHGVRPTDFLFLFDSDLFFHVVTTHVCRIWVSNTASLCYFWRVVECVFHEGGRKKGSQKISDLLPISWVCWQNLKELSCMTNALLCFELTFTARTPNVDGACHSNFK